MDFNKISDKFWGDPLDRDFTNKPYFHLQRTVAPWGKPMCLFQSANEPFSAHFKRCQPHITKQVCKNKKTLMPQSPVRQE